MANIYVKKYVLPLVSKIFPSPPPSLLPPFFPSLCKDRVHSCGEILTKVSLQSYYLYCKTIIFCVGIYIGHGDPGSSWTYWFLNLLVNMDVKETLVWRLQLDNNVQPPVYREILVGFASRTLGVGLSATMVWDNSAYTFRLYSLNQMIKSFGSKGHGSKVTKKSA